MAIFASSTRFQSWAGSLRLAWMGIKGRAQALAYATVLGDWTINWMTAALLERMPAYASSWSVALLASERQLDAVPTESVTAIAARAPFWIALGEYAGTPLGLLLGLHFSGYDNLVLVQQNGLAYQLTLPLPPFVLGQTWNPTPNLVVTPTATLSVALGSSINIRRSIPAGNSWATWDFNTDYTSRFSILVPNTGTCGPFLTYGTATFTGVEDGSVANPWPVAVWNNAFPDTTYRMRASAPSIADGSGLVSVALDATTKTTTGCAVTASGPFVGTVDVLAYQATALSPWADPHPTDLTRMQSVIKKWKPQRAQCIGVYALVRGQFWAWPVRTLGQSTTWGPSSSVGFLTGGF